MSKNNKDETNYLALGISLGTSLGVVFGLLVFDNLAIGLPIGILFGTGIGGLLQAEKNKSDKQG